MIYSNSSCQNILHHFFIDIQSSFGKTVPQYYSIISRAFLVVASSVRYSELKSYHSQIFLFTASKIGTPTSRTHKNHFHYNSSFNFKTLLFLFTIYLIILYHFYSFRQDSIHKFLLFIHISCIFS